MIGILPFVRANWKAIGMLALSVALFVSGYWLRGVQADRDIAKVQAIQATAIAAQQAKYRQKENEYALLNAKIDGQYLELAAAHAETANLRASIASGGKRLSVRTVPGTCRVPKDSTVAGVDHETARADIDPRDAVDIIAIVARGDEAIRQLNALQDREEGLSSEEGR